MLSFDMLLVETNIRVVLLQHRIAHRQAPRIGLVLPLTPCYMHCGNHTPIPYLPVPYRRPLVSCFCWRRSLSKHKLILNQHLSSSSPRTSSPLPDPSRSGRASPIRATLSTAGSAPSVDPRSPTTLRLPPSLPSRAAVWTASRRKH